jgi:hypothetical protein
MRMRMRRKRLNLEMELRTRLRGAHRPPALTRRKCLRNQRFLWGPLQPKGFIFTFFTMDEGPIVFVRKLYNYLQNYRSFCTREL